MTSKGIFGALLACVISAHAQEEPTAEVSFAFDTFFASEIDGRAEIVFMYSVTSPLPPGMRRHVGPSDLVKLNIVGGTAINTKDYWDVPEYVYFDGNWGSHVKTISFDVSHDDVTEGDESIELELAPGWGNTTLRGTRTKVVIVDSNVGKVRFAETNLVASEAAGFVEGTLLRELGIKGPIEVTVQPWFGYETNRAGFEDAGEPVVVKFADGQDRASFKLMLTQDSLVEGPEKLTVRLADDRQFAYVSKEQLVVTIIDDSLEIARSDGGIIVSWADSCPECELQVSETAAASSWRKVEAVATQADNKYSVNEPAIEAGKFYRMKR